jgi:hypothetical protein
MASKKLSTDTSLANSYKLSRGVASVARPSAPTIGTATDGGSGNMSVTFTASTLGPTASSFSLTSSSGVTGSGASSPLTLQEVATGTYTYSVSGVNANGTGPSSAASNSVVVANVFAPSGAFDSIATVSVGAGGSDTITFSSIPATYTHLQIRAIFKNEYLTYGGAQNFTWRCNGDTAGNYASQSMHATGDTAAAATTVTSEVNATYMTFPHLNVSDNVANDRYAICIMEVQDYRNTNKFKTFRNIGGVEQKGTSGFTSSTVFQSGLWRSTAAITSIVITGYGDFKQYSHFALYGIKGE